MARNAGFSCSVRIADVGRWYREQAAANSGEAKDASPWCNALELHPLPDAFQLGGMGGFFTWQEMLEQLDAMRAAHPDLISEKVPFGISVEGRPLHMVRISTTPDVDADKPEVLYDALHHAREPASMHQLITFMWYLLERYGTDPEVTYLVDHLELYFVPCINPDGYVYNELMDPAGGGLWRKNRRPNGDGTVGVDLNRNYGEGWGADDLGSSPEPFSDVYRGPAPFSEPETQAIRDLCNTHEFRLALNNHTFGNLLVYPWGYLPSFYTPDSAVFVNHGVQLTTTNRYRFGTADQTVNYVVNGGSDDWMYGEQQSKPKIIAMTPEAGFGNEGFWPPPSRIPTICQENIGPNLRLAHLALTHGVAEDRTPAIVGGSDPHVRFTLRRLGVEPGPLTVSVEALENVTSVGAPITFSALEMLEVVEDSIPFQIDPALNEGATFSYILAVSNGAFTHRDTITKVFGQPVVVFAEDGNSLSEWTNNGWATTTSAFLSPPASITESPSGNYPDNANRRLTLTQPIDLSGAAAAMLTFRARWDLEAYYDAVQVLVSSDGVSWTPLCGRHTRPGSTVQGEDEPVLDGQQPNWVVEEMSLNDHVGGPLRLRLQLRSDEGGTYDGIQVDDLLVTVTGLLATGVEDASVTNRMLVHPQPASDQVMVSVNLPAGGKAAELLLRDALGALVGRSSMQGGQGTTAMNVSHLAPGVYHLSAVQQGRVVAQQRLVVMRP